MENLFCSWLAEQEVRGSILGLAATISEIDYLLLSSRDMAGRSLKRRKSSKEPTNNQNERSVKNQIENTGLRPAFHLYIISNLFKY